MSTASRGGQTADASDHREPRARGRARYAQFLASDVAGPLARARMRLEMSRSWAKLCPQGQRDVPYRLPQGVPESL